MASRHNFRKLEIWKLGISLSKDIYTITATFPKSETYGLTNQLQRAAVSIPSNISEEFFSTGNRQTFYSIFGSSIRFSLRN